MIVNFAAPFPQAPRVWALLLWYLLLWQPLSLWPHTLPATIWSTIENIEASFRAPGQCCRHWRDHSLDSWVKDVTHSPLLLAGILLLFWEFCLGCRDLKLSSLRLFCFLGKRSPIKAIVLKVAGSIKILSHQLVVWKFRGGWASGKQYWLKCVGRFKTALDCTF